MLAAPVQHPAVGRSLARVDVEGGPVDPVILGQQIGERGRLVGRTAGAVVALDLWERDRIGAAHGLGDARQVRATHISNCPDWPPESAPA